MRVWKTGWLNSLVEITLTSFVVALSGALAPGPLMVTAVRESTSNRSSKPGLLLSLGHALAEAPVTVILVYGLLSVDKSIFPYLSLIGGVFLVATGILAVIRPGRKNVDEGKTIGTRGFLTLIMLGAAVSFSNPYWTTWWVTIGAAYVTKALTVGGLGVLFFYLSHEIGDLLVLGLISKAAASGADNIGEKGFRILMIVCNLAIIVIGVYFILEGVKALSSAA
ncbi:MAG: LysE family transporter [Candidatus Brockarchaeota archaeon]|nr:LysE family transporter [Candidatus Brockarchaeota archaeon]